MTFALASATLGLDEIGSQYRKQILDNLSINSSPDNVPKSFALTESTGLPLDCGKWDSSPASQWNTSAAPLLVDR